MWSVPDVATMLIHQQQSIQNQNLNTTTHKFHKFVEKAAGMNMTDNPCDLNKKCRIVFPKKKKGFKKSIKQ